MSAYIVKDETINRILSFIGYDNDNRYYLEHHGIKPFEAEEYATLGEAMFRLNVLAVEARYGKGEAEKFRPLDYRFSTAVPRPIVPTIKSLQCYLYQCSEGDVPKRDLYKALEGYVNILCQQVVNNLPTYNNAKWD